MGLAKQLLRSEILADFTATRKRDKDRYDLLTSSKKLTAQVADVTKQLHPFTKKPKGTTKFVIPYEAYDRKAESEGHPMAGFGKQLHQEYEAALANPKYHGYSPREILSGVTSSIMQRPGKEGELSRLEGSHRTKLIADTDVGRLFGYLGEDKSIKAIPGFEEYKEDILTEEPAKSEPFTVGESAIFGSGLTAVGMLAKEGLRVAGMTALAPFPGARPTAAVLGAAALLAIPADKVFDYISNTLSKTDWGRARRGTWRKIGADLLVSGGIFGGAATAGRRAYKRLATKGIKAGHAFDELLKSPTGETVIKLQKATKEEAIAALKVDTLLDSSKAKVKSTVYDFLTDITEKQDKVWKTAFKNLDDEGTDMALDLAKKTGLKEGVKRVMKYQESLGKQYTVEDMKAYIVSKAKVTDTFDPTFGTAELVKPAKKVKPKVGRPKEPTKKEVKLSLAERMAARKEELVGEGVIKKGVKKSPIASEGEIQARNFLKQHGHTDPWHQALIDDLPPEPGRVTGVDIDKIILSSIGAIAGAITFDILNPPEAEAFIPGVAPVVKQISKKLIKPTTKGLLLAMERTGYWVKPVTYNATELPEVMMRQASMAKEATEKLGSIGATIKKTTTGVGTFGRLLSPYTVSKQLFKTGYNLTAELGHMVSAAHVNSSNAFTVAKNILKPLTGVRRTNKVVQEAMEPLAKKYQATVAVYGTAKGKLKRAESDLKGMLKVKKPRNKAAHLKLIGRKEKDIAHLKVAVDELEPVYQSFLKEYDPVIKSLADEHSTTRIFLGAEDTVDFVHYPWLKNMLTSEEKIAVTQVKDFFNNYSGRMKELKKAGHKGIDTIDHRPFVHYARHQSWVDDDLTKVMAGLDTSVTDAMPFTKFHSRSLYAKPLVPDIAHSLQRYIPDAERRLGWSRFWGKGLKNSWHDLSTSSIVQGTEIGELFQRLKDASKPFAQTTGNTLANRYSSLEVARLLAFAPSVAFKHLFKLMGTFATMGIKTGLNHTLDGIMVAARTHRNSPEVVAKLSKFGIKGTAKKKFYDDAAWSFLHQGRMMNQIADLEFGNTVSKGYMGMFDTMLGGINKAGSVPIRSIEYFDRSMTFLTSMEMAAKRGLTPKQAIFGMYSSVLKNNFLSGPLNPSWMLNPKIRALFLFQNTAFKIMERRTILAMRGYKAGKAAIKTLKVKHPVTGKSVYRPATEILGELTDVRRFIKSGERDFKRNLIADALGSQKDYYGTSVTRQLMREILLAGSVVSGGAHIGLDFMPHTFHVPFLVHGRTEPTLATAPAAKAIIQTYEYWLEDEEDDRDFIVTQFLKSWLGSTKGIPQTANKMLRISDNDIPDIYDDSPMQYLFSVPTYGEHY